MAAWCYFVDEERYAELCDDLVIDAMAERTAQALYERLPSASSMGYLLRCLFSPYLWLKMILIIALIMVLVLISVGFIVQRHHLEQEGFNMRLMPCLGFRPDQDPYLITIAFRVFLLYLKANFGLGPPLHQDQMEAMYNFYTVSGSLSLAKHLQQASKYRSGIIAANDLAEEACIICREDYDAGRLVAKLHCGHLHHTSCLARWVDQSGRCPTCNQSIAGSGQISIAKLV